MKTELMVLPKTGGSSRNGVGLALCCGTTPQFKTHPHRGFECPVCGRNKFGWGGSPEWLAGLWNQSANKASWNVYGEHWSEKTLVCHRAGELDLDGWNYAVLEYSYHPPYGGKQSAECDFSLFQAPGRSADSLLKSKDGYECVIDDSRCLNPVRLRTMKGDEILIEIPPFKKSAPVSMYVGRSWSTDQCWWYRLYITTYNHKWHRKMMEALCGIEAAFPQLQLKGN